MEEPRRHEEATTHLVLQKFYDRVIKDYVGRLAVLYDRTVSDPRQVWQLIQWKLLPVEVAQASRSPANLMFLCIQRSFRRYLLGKGHPAHPSLFERGQITQADVSHDAENAVLRAELFLMAMTDSRTLPCSSGEDAQFTVRRATRQVSSFLTIYPDRCRRPRGAGRRPSQDGEKTINFVRQPALITSLARAHRGRWISQGPVLPYLHSRGGDFPQHRPRE